MKFICLRCGALLDNDYDDNIAVSSITIRCGACGHINVFHIVNNKPESVL